MLYASDIRRTALKARLRPVRSLNICSVRFDSAMIDWPATPSNTLVIFVRNIFRSIEKPWAPPKIPRYFIVCL